jgi:hypothetical protein
MTWFELFCSLALLLLVPGSTLESKRLFMFLNNKALSSGGCCTPSNVPKGEMEPKATVNPWAGTSRENPPEPASNNRERAFNLRAHAVQFQNESHHPPPPESRSASPAGARQNASPRSVLKPKQSPRMQQAVFDLEQVQMIIECVSAAVSGS